MDDSDEMMESTNCTRTIALKTLMVELLLNYSTHFCWTSLASHPHLLSLIKGFNLDDPDHYNDMKARRGERRWIGDLVCELIL